MKTLIAVPCMSMVYADFMQSMVALDKPEGCELFVQKNTLIYDARNRIAAAAISGGFDRVFWVDSDMVIPRNALMQLSADMDQGLDYVAGLCFTRSMPIHPVVYSAINYSMSQGKVESSADVYSDYPQNTLFKCAGTGFGCVMTSTALLQAVIKEYGTPFTPIVRLGEDMGFCYKATSIGASLWCDSSVKLGHVGEFVYSEQYYQKGH